MELFYFVCPCENSQKIALDKNPDINLIKHEHIQSLSKTIKYPLLLTKLSDNFSTLLSKTF